MQIGILHNIMTKTAPTASPAAAPAASLAAAPAAAPAASPASGSLPSNLPLKPMANALRALSMDAVELAKSGHPGMPMGCADLATVLYTQFLRFDATAPHWPNRDRLILSAGHGSMLLYSLAYLAGYAGMDLAQIKAFRQLGSRTPGHPEHDVGIGVETTTGPLGQGLANAVGMAMAERHLSARFGSELIDHHIYVIASDGDLMEGISHEAASLAGHLGLSRLIVLYDDNRISIDGPTSLSFSDDTLARFRAYGWHASSVDGHDVAALQEALQEAQQSHKPTLLACRTIIGFGAPAKAGSEKCHGAPLGAAEIAGARAKLDWPHPPFFVPEDILQAWRDAGKRSQEMRLHWEAKLAQHPERAAFMAALSGAIPAAATESLGALAQRWASDKPKLASRQSSGLVLETLMPALPSLLGGSADLSGSNNTQTPKGSIYSAQNYAGRYVHYGVREHAMVAAMNGMALYGGIIPYAGTFLQFADYCRPAIRLAALMRTRIVLVMTHDSIGLGEDGPTHQPIEHLAALRAMPNLRVFRPADAVEVAECWALAIAHAEGPSLLALTRQALPTLRDAALENNSARGAYMLQPAIGQRRVTLLATGSEVAIAAEARVILEASGIGTALVSAPCFELLAQQSSDYQTQLLGGPDVLRVGVEAAVQQGWERWLGQQGIFVGLADFGASAPAEALYEHFGITPAKIAQQVKDRLKERLE